MRSLTMLHETNIPDHLESTMSDMNVQQFAEKLVKDKEFRKEVINQCYDFEPPANDKHGLGIWLNAGAERMGYTFDSVELHDEIFNRVQKLNAFKKIAFMGSLVTIANKAKKAAKAAK